MQSCNRVCLDAVNRINRPADLEKKSFSLQEPKREVIQRTGTCRCIYVCIYYVCTIFVMNKDIYLYTHKYIHASSINMDVVSVPPSLSQLQPIQKKGLKRAALKLKVPEKNRGFQRRGSTNLDIFKAKINLPGSNRISHQTGKFGKSPATQTCRLGGGYVIVEG